MGGNAVKRKNILLVKGKSRYDSTDNYIDEWAAAIRQLGCNTCVLDGWSLANPKLYNHVLATYKFDAALDCNGSLSNWNATDNLPKDTIIGTYLCDPPPGLRERLEKADDRTIVFGCDKNFCNYMDQYFPMIKHTKFIPLSGSFCTEYVPYEERSIDILFTGSYDDPEEWKMQAYLDIGNQGVLKAFLNDMLDDIIINPQYTLWECLKRNLLKYQITVNEREFDELATDFMAVDFYARFYYRDKLIRTLLEAGLQIHVFGIGWEKFHSDYKYNLIIHEGGTYAARKALADAKISLNIMPWFKDAFQERIASAMLSKAVAVTDESKYILNNFENDKEMIIFSLKSLDLLAVRIKHLLEYPQAASEIAENGYKKVQNHTWYHRVYDMMRAIETDFDITLIQEGQGEELSLTMKYPDEHTIGLDAIYELHKLYSLVDQDILKVKKLSHSDCIYLIQKFINLKKQFGDKLPGIEMNPYIENGMRYLDTAELKQMVELFSMQCKAMMSGLLMKEANLNL